MDGETMREHKFRAWDKQEKQMMGLWDMKFYNIKADIFDHSCLCYGTKYVVGNPTEKYWHGNNIHEHDKFQERFEVMQYTGLKDKTGKEIYEGDIIKREIWSHTSGEFKIEVIYNIFNFFEQKGLEERFYNQSFDSIYLKVFGNIYENPELLKETKE
jgi:uncharacterized phage protein (TIGR01671 family)